MQQGEFRRNLIQVGILFLAYYIIPPLIREIIGAPADTLSRYAPAVVEILIAGLMIFKLMEMKKSMEEAAESVVAKLAREEIAGRKRKQLASNGVLLLYLILISVVAVPIVEEFVNPKTLTIVKIALVGIGLFLLYQVWNLFGSPSGKSRSDENKPG